MDEAQGIEVVGVGRSFRAKVALDSVDLSVHPGEVVALLGPNGAGKSTLVRILATTVMPDRGMAAVGGHDVVKDAVNARRQLGLMLAEERSFFWRLTGRANLEFFAALRGVRRKEASDEVRRVLEIVTLTDAADVRVDRYSSGMRARLGLARALLGQPAVLVLDEPTRSLDPVVAADLRHFLTALAARESTAVLITTHDLHEAAVVASNVVLLVAGRVARRLPGGTDAASLEAALLEAVG